MKYNLLINVELELDEDRLEDEDFEDALEIFQSGAIKLGAIDCTIIDENKNDVTQEFSDGKINEEMRNFVLAIINYSEEEEAE
jgi:hypothetical protein